MSCRLSSTPTAVLQGLGGWLYGMRKAAISWEKNYAEKLAGGIQGKSCCADDSLQHGDPFSGTQVEFEKMRGLFEVVRCEGQRHHGSGTGDVKEVVI